MDAEKPLKTQEKAVKLNSDIYSEDYALLNQVIEEKSLLSRKEGLHVIFNGYRGLPSTEKHECLCFDASTSQCLKNPDKIKKTDALHCKACLKAQQLAEERYREQHEERLKEDEFHSEEIEFWNNLGAKGYFSPIDRVHLAKKYLAKKDKEVIAELEKQDAEIERLKQINEETSTKYSSDRKLLYAELEQRNKEIKSLKADLEQKDEVIKTYMFNEGKAK